MGAELLRVAEAWLRQHAPSIDRLDAEVLGDNDVSHRLFSHAGFRRTATHYSKRLNR